MKVLVLGAGVIGVSTAYYLAKAGHEVTVLDRREGPGLETSFANGGQVVPSHAEPWAGPGTPITPAPWLRASARKAMTALWSSAITAPFWRFRRAKSLMPVNRRSKM